MGSLSPIGSGENGFLGNSPLDMLGGHPGAYLGSIPFSAMYLLKSLGSANPFKSDEPLNPTGMGAEGNNLLSAIKDLGANPATLVSRRGLDPRARLMVAKMFNVPLPGPTTLAPGSSQGANIARNPGTNPLQYADIPGVSY